MAPAERLEQVPRRPGPMVIAVIEMGQSSWLVAGVLPGIESQPRKKLEAGSEAARCRSDPTCPPSLAPMWLARSKRLAREYWTSRPATKSMAAPAHPTDCRSPINSNSTPTFWLSSRAEPGNQATGCEKSRIPVLTRLIDVVSSPGVGQGQLVPAGRNFPQAATPRHCARIGQLARPLPALTLRGRAIPRLRPIPWTSGPPIGSGIERSPSPYSVAKCGRPIPATPQPVTRPPSKSRPQSPSDENKAKRSPAPGVSFVAVSAGAGSDRAQPGKRATGMGEVAEFRPRMRAHLSAPPDLNVGSTRMVRAAVKRSSQSDRGGGEP